MVSKPLPWGKQASGKSQPRWRSSGKSAAGSPRPPIPRNSRIQGVSSSRRGIAFMLPRGSSDRAGMFPQDGGGTQGLWNPVGSGFPFPQRGDYPEPGLRGCVLSSAATFWVFKVLADRVLPLNPVCFPLLLRYALGNSSTPSFLRFFFVLTEY